MELTQLHQFQRYVFHGSFVGPFCAGCAAAFKQSGQRFKRGSCAYIADPAAAHANSVALLQQGLFPIGQSAEGFIHIFCFYAGAQDASIIPMIRDQVFILSPVLFFVIFIPAFRQLTPFPLPLGGGQLFGSRLFCTSGLHRKQPDRFFGISLALGKKLHDAPGVLVFLEGIEGIEFLLHAEPQQRISDIPVNICDEGRSPVGIIGREAFQYFNPAFQLQIHEPLRRKPVRFTCEKCVDPIIEIALILMQIKENVFDLMGFLGQADEIVCSVRC